MVSPLVSLNKAATKPLFLRDEATEQSKKDSIELTKLKDELQSQKTEHLGFFFEKQKQFATQYRKLVVFGVGGGV